MEKLLFVLLTFIISAAIGWITIPRIVIISKIKRLFDKPDARKVHQGSVPRLGGVSFFPGMMVSVAMMLGFRYYFEITIPTETELMFVKEFMFLLSGMFILFFVGLADDLIGVGYRYKFLAQTIAASMIIFTGMITNDYMGVVGLFAVPMWFANVTMVLFIVFIVNSYNLIDGVDGLCSGLSIIALSCMGGWFIYINLFVYAMIAFGMLGVTLAFFIYNTTGRRLKVFMGDTGSLTLGYLIIVLCIKFLQQASPSHVNEMFYAIKHPIAIMLSMVYIPMFDTLRVFISRISRNKSPFHPDKTHIHHKLLAIGYSHLQSTLLLLVAQVLFIALTILLSEILALNINVVVVVDIVLAVGLTFMINKIIAHRAKTMLAKVKNN